MEVERDVEDDEAAALRKNEWDARIKRDEGETERITGHRQAHEPTRLRARDT